MDRVTWCFLLLALLPLAPSFGQQSTNHTSQFIRFREQAIKGEPTAQYYLGLFYHKGWGVTKDYALAIYWYRKSAEAGTPHAMLELALMYKQGQGVQKDEIEALAWLNIVQGYFEEARTARDDLIKVLTPDSQRKAMVRTGYYRGTMFPEDSARAAFWYRKGAEEGIASAQFKLGAIYSNGEGAPKDDAQAVFWWRRAAEQGHALAQVNLGVMYRNGVGVVQDDTQAAFWYRKAAEQGLASAQFYLGSIYENGEGVPKDEAQAVFWHRKAAGQTYARAQFRLGFMYGMGRGVPKDNIESYAWLSLASVSSDEAKAFRDVLEKTLSPEAIKRAQARTRELQELTE